MHKKLGFYNFCDNFRYFIEVVVKIAQYYQTTLVYQLHWLVTLQLMLACIGFTLIDDGTILFIVTAVNRLTANRGFRCLIPVSG